MIDSTPAIPASTENENYIRIQNNKIYYLIGLKILNNNINISLFQENDTNIFFENNFSLQFLKEKHKYLSLSENLNDAFGILNQYLCNSYFNETNLENCNNIKLNIPITFFGKITEITLILIKSKKNINLTSILKNYNERISKLEEKVAKLELRISKLEGKNNEIEIQNENPIKEKIENLIQENEVTSSFSSVFDIYILKNGNIITGTEKGMIIYNPVNLTEIQKISYPSYVLCVFELRNGNL